VQGKCRKALRKHGPRVDQMGASNQIKPHQMAIDCKEKISYPALVSATVRCRDIAWIGRIRNAKVVGSTPALGNPLQAGQICKRGN
jgi:hypothetical protein